MYGAQFNKAMRAALPDMDGIIRAGNFSPILAWLRENIHQHGRTFTAEEICRRVTGESLNPDYFMAYLEEKFSKVYEL